MKLYLIFSLLLISSAFCNSFDARVLAKKNSNEGAKRVSGEWIVKFMKGAPREVIKSAIDKFQDEYGSEISYWSKNEARGNIISLAGLSEENVNEFINEFFEHIDYVEPNFVVQLDLGEGIGDAMDKRETQNVTSWGLDRVDQRDLPLDGVYTYSFTGKDVNVYVVDSGVRINHPDLEGRASFAFSAYADSGQDDNGHGTHVAGIVASKTYGVAKNAKIHNVKVLGAGGSGSSLDVLRGFQYIADNYKKPAIVQMSIGFNGAVRNIEDIIRELRSKGILTVIASGNSGIDACRTSPASDRSSLSVGATTKGDLKASFSNYGKCVDIFAPGVDILSLGNIATTRILSGTSMAAPYISGLAALYLEQDGSTSPSKLSSKILNSATKLQSNINNGLTSYLIFTNSAAGLSTIFAMKYSLYVLIPLITLFAF